jgi:hypothetical protein
MSEEQNRIYFAAGAHHEAGHALIAIAMGARNVSAQVGPYPRCVGKTHYELGPAQFDPTKLPHFLARQKEIMVAMAGHQAELMYWATIDPKDQPHSIQNFDGDMKSAFTLAADIADSRLSPELVVQGAVLQSQLVLDKNTAILKRIANALIERQQLDDAALRAFLSA